MYLINRVIAETLGRRYPRGLIVDQQIYRYSDETCIKLSAYIDLHKNVL